MEIDKTIAERNGQIHKIYVSSDLDQPSSTAQCVEYEYVQQKHESKGYIDCKR